ncbi:hypothetical protein ACJRO7_000130 [Eucalyptus globulus]|uniref:Uncharacterized protein n=1 Tax=Eucalyptus globulus TaxID=34317 RepID=A0ABD3LSA3_EUCGL
MEDSLPLPFRSVRPRLHRPPATASLVTCGLRNSTRRPLWRSDMLSTDIPAIGLRVRVQEGMVRMDLALRCDMIQLLGKNKMVALAEVVFSGLLKEGVEPDSRAYAERIGTYPRVDMIERGMQTYEKMKADGCTSNEFTLMILIRNLEKAGEKDLVEFVKRDFVEYLDSPEKFLEPKRRSFDLV